MHQSPTYCPNRSTDGPAGTFCSGTALLSAAALARTAAPSSTYGSLERLPTCSR